MGERKMFTRAKNLGLAIATLLILAPLPLGVLDKAAAGTNQGRIAFVREGNIWIMDADGGNQVQLTTPGSDSQPEWSPDGNSIAYVRDFEDRLEIQVMQSDGTDTHCIAQLFPQALSGLPEVVVVHALAWLPDGEHLVVVIVVTRSMNTEQYMLNVTEQCVRIPYDLSPADFGERVGRMFWSASGQVVYEVTRLEPPGQTVYWDFDLWQAEACGLALCDPLRLTDTDAWREESPVLSPRSDRILYARNTGFNEDELLGEVRVRHLDSQEDELVYTTVGQILKADWSPDGSQIAFFVWPGWVLPPWDSSAEGEIWLVSADGTDPHKVAVGRYPAWQPMSSVVSGARADIGMPYSAYRGCPSPYVGCGGPYHGFYYGVCTDLAMDAYNAGASLNLQDALYQDHMAHPGRYRYGTARYPKDMRRYFHHNQQLLLHSQAYQLGDIAFFDWGADSLSDHMGVISEIDADGRPLRMVHAPGVCEVNPSGRAFEQDWNSHYDQHVQGHGRLSETTSVMAFADETLQLLRVTVDSPSVAPRLQDANGKSTSDTYDENLVASGVEASIPYIPGGWYADLGTTKVITVTHLLSNTSQYFVELTAEAAVTYHLRIETLQGASVTDSQVFTQTAAARETHGSAITLSAPGGTIEFSATSPAPAPLPDIPESLELAGLVGTSAQATFTITETGGQQALQNVTLSATDLMDSLGGTVAGFLPVISPDDFTVSAGGSQQVNAQVSLADVAPGVYRGALVIRSDNGGTQMVPLTLEVQFHQVYLPTIFKSY